MKKLLVLAMSLLVLASCKKDKDDEATPTTGSSQNTNNNNNGNVPAAAVGQWLHGTFSMSSYWGYDGTYHGTPFSSSVAFDFKSSGSYEMFYTVQTNDFGCTTDAFSYFKGNAVFTDSSFIVHPTQGRFRGYYNCTPQWNFDRPALASELNVDTFYYRFETDVNNQKWMVIGFTPTDSFPSYFKAVSW